MPTIQDYFETFGSDEDEDAITALTPIVPVTPLLHLTGSPADILGKLTDQHHELVNILLKGREIRHNKAIEEYQAAVLYQLAKRYDGAGRWILEIGAARGYSASILAQASHAQIVTLNPDAAEAEVARRNLARFGASTAGGRLSVEIIHSWDHLQRQVRYDFIFIDGDHKRVKLDLPWFNRLTPGGMILFHDYSPQESARPCQVVYDALNAMRDRLGRDFDVRVVDDQRVGMVGFVRREGETYVE